MNSRSSQNSEIKDFLQSPQLRHSEISKPRCGVSQGAHVKKLQDGPFPAIGFAPNDGQGRRTLHGECKEDHKGCCGTGTQIVTQGFLQVEGARGWVGAIDCAKCAHDHFSGEDGGE